MTAVMLSIDSEFDFTVAIQYLMNTKNFMCFRTQCLFISFDKIC